jgi:hypothetical protein
MEVMNALGVFLLNLNLSDDNALQNCPKNKNGIHSLSEDLYLAVEERGTCIGWTTK